MKRLLSVILCSLLLAGCSEKVDITDTSIPVKERATFIIHDVAGEKVGEDKLDTVKAIKEDKGRLSFEINTNAHEGSKYKLMKDSSEIFSKFSEMGDVKSVNVLWLAPLTDQYGKKSMKGILTMEIDEETFKKINWDNYENLDLEKLASHYSKHPALEE